MKKIGWLFFCFLPALSSFALQIAASFTVLGVLLLKALLPGTFIGEKIAYDRLLWDITSSLQSQDGQMLLFLIYSITCILIFSVWHTAQFGGDLRLPYDRFAKPGLLLGLIFLIPGLQMISALLTSISASFFPGWMDFYQKLFETAGMTDSNPSILLLLYSVLLGPISEELTFRGVTLSAAQKALPFWAANLFQALLFGVFHLNVIQGIYAVFIGLFLGYICHRGGSVWFSIFVHILFNAWGMLVSLEMSSILFFGLFILLGIFGFVLFYRNTSPAGVNNSHPFSDM